MTNNKLLIISGPTATGKTALAVELAKKFNGEIISADSRQIYKGLDIGTGKDHPKDVKVHLVDLISPDETFSVAQYRQAALKKIRELQDRNKLPILVGCSGFYIDSIINPNYNTFSVKPKFLLRKILFSFPTSLNQLILKTLNPKTFSSLNHSDKSNPIRLVRKIELSLSKMKPALPNDTGFDCFHISLIAPNQYLYRRIDKRVDERLRIGHLEEITELLKKYSWNDPGLKVSAYRSLKPYLDKTDTLEHCVQKWKFLEHRDARRQKTWFKIRANLTFIDISKPKYSVRVQHLVKKWYNQP